MRRHSSNSTIPRLGGTTRTGAGCSGFFSSSFRSPSWCWAVLRTLSPNVLYSFRSLVPVFCCFMSSACFFLFFLKKSIRLGAPSAAFRQWRVNASLYTLWSLELICAHPSHELKYLPQADPNIGTYEWSGSCMLSDRKCSEKESWDKLQTPKQSQTLLL
jgi:hypothetical protein